MAKINEQDWLKIKVKFESSSSDEISLESIANEFGCTKGLISQKAKKEGWIRSKTKQFKQENINAINELVAKTKQVKQIMPENEQPLFNLEILEDSKLKTVAKSVQYDLLKLINMATRQIEEIVISNPDGMHVKSKGDTITYGRNTEFIKDLIPVMGHTNAILGIGKNEINLTQQNNTQVNSGEPITINVNPVTKKI